MKCAGASDSDVEHFVTLAKIHGFIMTLLDCYEIFLYLSSIKTLSSSSIK